MKYILTYTLFLLTVASTLSAQTIPCFFDEYTNNEKLYDAERSIQKGVQQLLDENRNVDTIKAIPVVVHIIHNGGTENISLAQVESQIRILNEDYGRMPGTSGFGMGVDTGVRFFLANLDPEGRCTNGIVRVKSPLTNHQSYQRALLKELSFWDNSRYLNIYVVRNINGNVAGYSSFPGGPDEEDGMVVRHKYFGDIGTANGLTGRTTSHEIGHWMGLYHTFNNACGDDICTDGDYVCDTPPALSPNYNCSTKNTCHNDEPDLNDLKENYMDYTPGSCKNMFTQGQKMRIQSTLNEIRADIWSPENLLSTGYDSIYTSPVICPVAANFVTLTRDICFGNSVNFIDISLNDATEWQWSFEGGIPATSTEQNPIISYNNVGIYNVTLIASDGMTTDTLTYSSYINVDLPGIGGALAYNENFDEGLFPPMDVIINNPDGGITWELDSLAARSGMYSIRINNLINTNYGTIDEIVLPNMDFTSVSPDSALYMSFDWAYAKSDPSFSDELLVLLSFDCGTTFTQIFYKSGNALATGPTQTTSFVPDSTQWKFAFINLNSYKEKTFVQVKIVNVTDGGNNLYIDDLYIGNGSELVATNDILNHDNNVKIYPNPAYDNINIQVEIPTSETFSVKLLNGQGILLQEIPKENYTLGEHELSFSTATLSNGIYFVVLDTDAYRKVIKVLVLK